MSAEVADVLDEAAEVIEVQGWQQGGVLGSESGPCCALIALDRATNGKYPLFEDSSASLRRQIGRNSVVLWNDTLGRTAAEVIAALRNAAAAERVNS